MHHHLLLIGSKNCPRESLRKNDKNPNDFLSKCILRGNLQIGTNIVAADIVAAKKAASGMSIEATGHNSDRSDITVADSFTAPQLYADACAFTRQQYKSRFGCDLASFYPMKVVSRTNGSIDAVVGIRGASHTDLYLEQYFDAAIEVVIEEKTGLRCSRDQIVEIGSFAATSQIAALPLMRETAGLLHAKGYRTAVSTANRAIRCCLAKLRLPTHRLAKVSSAATDRDWGSYYDGQPVVLYGDILRCAVMFNKALGLPA
jgi:hypothetical protein